MPKGNKYKLAVSGNKIIKDFMMFFPYSPHKRKPCRTLNCALELLFSVTYHSSMKEREEKFLFCRYLMVAILYL